jgi:hypothetical protein
MILVRRESHWREDTLHEYRACCLALALQAYKEIACTDLALQLGSFSHQICGGQTSLHSRTFIPGITVDHETQLLFHSSFC